MSLFEAWAFMNPDGQCELVRGLGKAIDSLFVLTTTWNERNGRVFRNEATTARQVTQHIQDEAKLWISAGVKNLGCLMSLE